MYTLISTISAETDNTWPIVKGKHPITFCGNYAVLVSRRLKTSILASWSWTAVLIRLAPIKSWSRVGPKSWSKRRTWWSRCPEMQSLGIVDPSLGITEITSADSLSFYYDRRNACSA